MSRVLDDNPTVAELVLQDLRAATRSMTAVHGAGGLSADQVLRILVVKQMNGFSYRELAFHLADSRSYLAASSIAFLGRWQQRSGLRLFIESPRPRELLYFRRPAPTTPPGSSSMNFNAAGSRPEKGHFWTGTS